MRKWLMCFGLALYFVLGVMTGGCTAAAVQHDFSDLVILHTNDTHGYDQRSDESGVNGMAAVAGLRDKLIADGKNVLLLDAGDAIQDNNLVNFSKGASAIEFMNAVGYDAMCLGNHEFDYGQDVTQKRMSEAMAVGRVMINKDVDDDSPVEYPDVPQYTEWHAYNGKLILVQGRRELEGVVINGKTKRDTFTFVYMKGDSLALSDREGRIQGFHRSLNAMKANAKAHAAAEKLNSKMKKEILK